MHSATVRQHEPTALPIAWYSVLGVPVAIISDLDETLLRVDETYTAFRAAPGSLDQAIVLRLERALEGEGYTVVGISASRRWPAYEMALLDLFDRLVHALLARLLDQGIYVIHAGAVVRRGAALALAGRSGQGKTTLTLGLMRRGLGLLSDEFAVVGHDARQLLPYHRSLHVRPGTPELIPELRFLYDRPQHSLGGGSEWAVTPHDLERAMPGCLASAAPLRHVLLIDGQPSPDTRPMIVPIPAALAALDLLRGAWAASVDFDGALAQVGQLLDGVICARLRSGALEPTLDAILAWQESNRG